MPVRLWRPRPRPRHRDEGGLSIMVAATTAAIVVLVGLVVDGGGRMRASAKADALAAEAARAAGQAIDPGRAVPGEAIVVDPGAATAAARGYLERAGARGTVRVTENGRAIEVDVTLQYRTVVAGLFGADTLTVRGHARGGLVHGIDAPEGR
jgi:hypothetical protein